MTNEIEDFIQEQLHNEKVRKRIQKFHETGKFLDDDGKEIEIGHTVNYKLRDEK